MGHESIQTTVFPAYAGMSPSVVFLIHVMTCFPRLRGDEPAV